jgi:calcineurin-like phosphoesterase family protein
VRPFRPFASIEEHDEELVKRWNGIVRKGDTVWHLGDFAFGRAKIDIAGRLNGTKKLVMGNHDHYPTEAYSTESQNHRANRQFLLGATRVCFVINWGSTVRGGWGGS